MDKHIIFFDAGFKGFIIMVFGTAIAIITSIIGMLSSAISGSFMNFFWWLLVLVVSLSIIAIWSIGAHFTIKLRERKKKKGHNKSK